MYVYNAQKQYPYMTYTYTYINVCTYTSTYNIYTKRQTERNDICRYNTSIYIYIYMHI